MKKLIPVLIILSLALGACSALPFGQPDETLTDTDMATRVAELLATMTTPTTELVFPPTPTTAPPTATATPEPTAAPTAELTEAPTGEPTASAEATTEPEVTGTVEATVEPPTATATVQPTVTGTPQAGDPVLKLGAPTGIDPFDNETKWVWPTGTDAFSTMSFKDGYMWMTGLDKLAGWRLPMLDQQVNNYFELTANSGACSAKDSYGIIFRVPVLKELNQGYLYEVTCDGYLRLWKWDGAVKPKGQATILINWKQSMDIKTGANQVNRLGVMVVDKSIKVYINGVQQGEVSDGSFSAGFFGVFVRAVSTEKYTVKFDEMKYWDNPPK